MSQKDKTARAAYMREWLAKNRNAENARRRAKYAARPEEERVAIRKASRQRWRRWVVDHSEQERKRNRERMRAKKWGFTPEEYDARVAAQDGRCAICKDKMDPPHVDHDHTTNELRAFLCFQCNVGLGHFDDSADLLQRAAEYVRRYKLKAVG